MMPKWLGEFGGVLRDFPEGEDEANFYRPHSLHNKGSLGRTNTKLACSLSETCQSSSPDTQSSISLERDKEQNTKII